MAFDKKSIEEREKRLKNRALNHPLDPQNQTEDSAPQDYVEIAAERHERYPRESTGRSLGFRLFIGLVGFGLWSALGAWLCASTALVSFLFYVIGDGAMKVDGLAGNILEGVTFVSLVEKSEHRNLSVTGFKLGYEGIFAGFLERNLKVETLEIQKLSYEEIRLEKPSVGKLKADIEKALMSFETVALAGKGPLRNVSIGRVEIGEISYRAALGAPPITVGPILISNFVLGANGWHASKFEIGGKQIHAHADPGKRGLRFRATLEPEIFVDAATPFNYSNESASGNPLNAPPTGGAEPARIQPTGVSPGGG